MGWRFGSATPLLFCPATILRPVPFYHLFGAPSEHRLGTVQAPHSNLECGAQHLSNTWMDGWRTGRLGTASALVRPPGSARRLSGVVGRLAECACPSTRVGHGGWAWGTEVLRSWHAWRARSPPLSARQLAARRGPLLRPAEAALARSGVLYPLSRRGCRNAFAASGPFRLGARRTGGGRAGGVSPREGCHLPWEEFLS